MAGAATREPLEAEERRTFESGDHRFQTGLLLLGAAAAGAAAPDSTEGLEGPSVAQAVRGSITARQLKAAGAVRRAAEAAADSWPGRRRRVRVCPGRTGRWVSAAAVAASP